MADHGIGTCRLEGAIDPFTPIHLVIALDGLPHHVHVASDAVLLALSILGNAGRVILGSFSACRVLSLVSLERFETREAEDATGKLAIEWLLTTMREQVLLQMRALHRGIRTKPTFEWSARSREIRRVTQIKTS